MSDIEIYDELPEDIQHKLDATDKPWRDEELMYRLYHDHKLSGNKIESLVGCHRRTVYDWLEKHDFPIRSSSETIQVDTPEKLKDGDWLHEHHHTHGRSLRDIAEKIGVHHEHVRYWMEKHNIERRGRHQSRRSRPVTLQMNDTGHMRWRGADGSGGKHDVYVHRLLATLHYDLDEISDKEVHHRNHIPWDNRPDNLELLSTSDHLHHHAYQTDYETV